MLRVVDGDRPERLRGSAGRGRGSVTFDGARFDDDHVATAGRKRPLSTCSTPPPAGHAARSPRLRRGSRSACDGKRRSHKLGSTRSYDLAYVGSTLYWSNSANPSSPVVAAATHGRRSGRRTGEPRLRHHPPGAIQPDPPSRALRGPARQARRGIGPRPCRRAPRREDGSAPSARTKVAPVASSGELRIVAGRVAPEPRRRGREADRHVDRQGRRARARLGTQRHRRQDGRLAWIDGSGGRLLARSRGRTPASWRRSDAPSALARQETSTGRRGAPGAGALADVDRRRDEQAQQPIELRRRHGRLRQVADDPDVARAGVREPHEAQRAVAEEQLVIGDLVGAGDLGLRAQEAVARGGFPTCSGQPAASSIVTTPLAVGDAPRWPPERGDVGVGD